MAIATGLGLLAIGCVGFVAGEGLLGFSRHGL